MYLPSASAPAAPEDHFPPLTAAGPTLSTSSPFPFRISTVTGSLSLASPENDGVVTFERAAGAEAIVTTGAFKWTSKETASLLPGPSPIELSCTATAVYLPSARAPATPVVHLPALTLAGPTLSTGSPLEFRISTVTGSASLASPANVGVVTFDRAAGANVIFTTGAFKCTSNETASLSPSPSSIELSS